MKNIIAEITKEIAAIKGCQFASFTYLTKSSGKLARFTVALGFSYHKLVEKSVLELELLIKEHRSTWDKITNEAADAVMASLKKTLDAHSRGEQNEDYTKKNQYIPIGNGLSVNTTDNTIQLFGVINSETILKEGTYKKVNSAELTIAKRKIEKMLPISKFREFALDASQIEKVRVNGETFEIGE